MDISRQFLTEKAAAAFLAISTRTLQRMRCAGDGPRYVRAGKRRVIYGLSDLQQWAERFAFQSTAEEQHSAQHRPAKTEASHER